jgi:hypothetical protein
VIAFVFSIDAIHGFLQFTLCLEAFVVSVIPYADSVNQMLPSGMNDEIIRRVQRFAFELIGDDSNGAIRLVSERRGETAMLTR